MPRTRIPDYELKRFIFIHPSPDPSSTPSFPEIIDRSRLGKVIKVDSVALLDDHGSANSDGGEQQSSPAQFDRSDSGVEGDERTGSSTGSTGHRAGGASDGRGSSSGGSTGTASN
jgi:hypothetical protein